MLIGLAILIGFVVVVPLAILGPFAPPDLNDPLDRVTRVATWVFLVVALAAVHSYVLHASFAGHHGAIVGLTAVHFTFAGVGTLALARRARGSRRRLGDVATVATVVAPPVVALGFVTHHPLPQVGGAVLMSVGALAVAVAHLGDATAGRGGHWLLAMSGLAPWIAMVLAVSWAAGNYWDVPALSIPDMVRTHGVMNMVFVLAGLAGRWLESHDAVGRRSVVTA